MKNTRTICIAGKNEIAIYGVKKIIKNYPETKIVCLCNKSDSGFDGWQPSLKKFAALNNLNEVSLTECQNIDDLIFISLEYDTIIKPKLFIAKSLFNIHFSKLPKYRGVYTSIFPLLHGQNESGVTLHKIDEGIDTGEIIDQITFSIKEIKSSRELYLSYMEKAKFLIDKNLDNLIKENFTSWPQSTLDASYFSRSSINLSFININFKKKAFEVTNQIRAYSFREYQLPVCFNYPVCEAKVTNSLSKLKAGTLLNDTKNFFIISTLDYDVKLIKDHSKIKKKFRK